MQGPGISFLVRRARSTWLLLAGVAVTVLVTTGLAAVLWTFAAGAIQPGERSILAAPQTRLLALSGIGDAGQAAADSRLIRTTLRKAWPGAGFAMEGALWATPILLPPSPNGKATVQIQVAALDGIRGQAILTAGRWPGPPHPGGPLPVALPVAVASRLHLAPGSVLKVAARSGASGAASAGLLVTGLFRPRNPASTYWALDLLPASGISIQRVHVSYAGVGAPYYLASYGPAVVNPAAFGGGPGGLTVNQGTWFVLPQAAALAHEPIGTLARSTSQMVTHFLVAVPPYGLHVTSRLPPLLAGMARTSVLARSLFTIATLQLLLVAAAGLVLSARLLATVREEESALLRARGAGRWQVTRPVLAEAVILGAVAGTAGVLAGTHLSGLLANVGKVRLEGYQASGITPLAWLSALVMLAVCAAVMAWPALHAVTPGAARLRQGRQARLAGIAWAGGDLALVVLAALSVWELHGYSAVAHPVAGSLGIDPTVAFAPALALAGVAIVPLRTLPLLAKLADKASEHRRRLAAAMVSWQISRSPIRQAGPVLVVVVATATVTLALAGYASWQKSAADQAAFAVGSDVRVGSATAASLGTGGTITQAPGVTAATAASIAAIGHGSQLIGLDTSTAGRTILLRPDLSPLPVSTLWRRITPRRPAGLALPGRPARLEILAALGAGPHSSAGLVQRELGGIEVKAWVQDAGGATYQVPPHSPLSLPADGRQHALVFTLSGSRKASYPLRLLALIVTYTLPPFDAANPPAEVTARLTVSGLAVAPAVSGPFGSPFSHGAELAAWHTASSSPRVPAHPGAFMEPLPRYGKAPAVKGWHSTPGGSQQLTFTVGHDPSASIMRRVSLTPVGAYGQVTIMPRPPFQIVPAIATSGYLAANRLDTGSIVSVSLAGFPVPFRIVASVSRFPAVFGQGRVLIADLGAISDLLAPHIPTNFPTGLVTPLPVTRWWLRTSAGQVPQLPAGLSVADRARQQAALLRNPLLTAPRQAMLAIGVAAVLLGVLGFSVSVAASLRTRRAQSAVFAALGVGRRAQAGQLCLEQLVLSVPAAVAGLLAGIGLARLMVPAITLTAGAADPVPPPLTVVPLGQAAVLALITAAAPTAAAALSVIYRPDPAAQLRAETR